MEVIESDIKESSASNEIENRKKDLINFFKKKRDWIVYAILTIILSISVYIRTLPMAINPATGKPGLWDITTNTWTLGPDLDPFLFLRWAKYIAAHGKLFALDMLRYVPTAHICSGVSCAPVNPSGETILLPYMISWLYNILTIFSKDVTVTYAAVIFPVIMAVFTGIAFFLFTRKLFYKEDKKIANIIALISTLLFVLVPSLLPRAIAGIPEKESVAFFFIFIAFYFFLEAFTSDKLKKSLIFGTLAGISTGVLGLISGFSDLVFVIIAVAVLIEFLLGKMNRNKFYSFSAWIFGFIISTTPFSERFSISNLIQSTSTALCFIVFFILLIDFIIFDKKIFNLNEKLKKMKLPSQITSIIIGGLGLTILASILFGISFVPNIVKDVISNTIHPISEGRFSITVAENAQSYFISDWTNQFGPSVLNIPLYFWLFFVGSVFLFNYTIKFLEKKEKRILTFGYTLFLICLIFSKYSSSSVLNGDSTLSLVVYFLGALFFIGSLIYVYSKRHKEGKFSEIKELNSSYIFYLIFLTLTVIAARGAVRLIMVLGAASPIVIGFLAVKTTKNYFKEKEDFKKLIAGILALLILISLIFTIWTYYQNDKSMAENYVPGVYTWQWQKAMAWVRDNTPINAVFAHWWDYGYWVQTIGERATVLDGGNAIGYWDYFMGRNVLTGTNERDALDFLYAHNATNLLIDSTDIGKYGAFSSIGSNGSYDRYSWIPTGMLDSTQTKETANATTYVYSIGTSMDQDFIFNQDGNQILLPQGKAGVAAVTVTMDGNNQISQPIIYFAYNSQQYSMPLKNIYINGKLYNFDSGFDGGIYIFPSVDQTSDGKPQINPIGAAFYLSERTINSELVKLYLFNETSDYFKLVHTEDDLFIDSLKSQGINPGDFVYYQGLRGPIKIWGISYPADIKLNQTYLDTEYPAELETIVPGVY
jgi:asparagine N-glycosylation enzyme membrane subunit Stt3